ncbi:chemotaxis protein CheB [soil metagenome]
MEDLYSDLGGGDQVVTDTAPLVVGIGASAGGLEALQHFFDHLAADTEMAFVVVQHLSPDFKSLMDELLGRHTELPIQLVEDGMVVAPGHVYLIPPKKEMIISGGRLLLSERDRQQELSLPIDVFFRSLAQDCGSRAVAIVLSGSGSDGSRGIRDVHDAGGLVLAQDVESAQFAGMPRTAHETGIVDHTSAPQKMPRILEEHARRGAARHAGRKVRIPSVRAAAFTEVYRMLEEHYGIDFTHYKPSTITRRIERRLRLAELDDIHEYVEHLRSQRTELDTLYRDLLIGVTRFFRNEEAFQLLEERVLPELIGNGSAKTPLRVWVAGCATGEEAYSIAILLHELTQHLPERSFKIFATDVHRGSLELAGRGFFAGEALANVSQQRKDRYFTKVGSSYQVVPELRQSIVFAPHNVIRDAPFTRVDLVSCRNMLIYLQPSVQQKVLNQFHFSLNRGGVMFLGPSESPAALLKDFETLDGHWRLYRKHSDVRTPVDPRLQPRFADPRRPLPQAATPFGRYSMSHLLATYDVLLEDFMPPSLLVNDRSELVHAFGGASRYLRPRDGRQGLEIVDQVDEQLRPLLTGGVRRALLSPTPIAFKNVRVCAGDSEEDVTVTLRRVAPRSSEIPHVLITFETQAGALVRPPPSLTEIDVGQLSRDQLGTLQTELDYTKENLQAAVEQLETGNEELQASNEELMSSNEELQSTNEELQSVNEELYTVNAEYQSKIAELTELTNDMDNRLASTEIGTIFLDEKLRIRKFTPQIAESFNLLPQDVGRSIETFTNTMDHPELATDVRRVLATGERCEREVTDQNGRALFVRILPYRAKGGTAGAVITFVDISGRKAAEDALFHERYLLNSLLSSVPDAIYFRDTRGRFIRTNPAATARLGVDHPSMTVGKTPYELPDPETALVQHRQDEEVLRTGKPQHYKLESRKRGDDDVSWDLATRLPLRDKDGQIVGVIGIFRDVTTEKVAEEKNREAVRRRDEFLAMLSHELRNPLAAVVTATELMKGAPAKVKPTPELVEVIDRQSQQMSRLLDDLLDASRVTQNKIELRKTRLDLRSVVEDAVAASRPMLEAHQLRFSLVIDGQPLWIDGDASRLQQVCVNLLTNAAKYTPAGGHVSLDATTTGTHAVLRVRDDGVGIAPNMLEAIFDLFVQSNRTLERAQGGIGVGLTLAKSLIEMHGGTLTAHSEGEGKGSIFEVQVPLSTTRAVAVVPPSAARRVKGSRIVVVEDNQDAREMMCHLLTRAGFDCRSAGDGVAALALIDSFEPHAAIIDVGLPGIDGFEVARRLRSNPKHGDVILIAVTGYGQKTDKVLAHEAGFDSHLVKPVKLEQIARLLIKPETDGVAVPREPAPVTS